MAGEPARTVHDDPPSWRVMFSVELLPGYEGDCILLTYGDVDHPHRVLVDAGRNKTYRYLRKRLVGLPPNERELELLVISHVDRDHIAGVLSMLGDPTSPVSFRDIWFNGFHHLKGGNIEEFGAVQGEALTELLLRPETSWNLAFGGEPVEASEGTGPVILNGGLRLTILGPRREDLERLHGQWERECRKAGLIPGVRSRRDKAPPGYEALGHMDLDALADIPFAPDTSRPNGTSIILLAEYEGRRVLLAADGHADRLVSALGPLAETEAGGRVRLDAVKVPHHGSRYNVSRELVELIDSPRYLISTNGDYFKHPHQEAIARILKYSISAPVLVFNYRSEETTQWDDDERRANFQYTTKFPAPPKEGTIAVEL
jgi:hypothetical protein